MYTQEEVLNFIKRRWKKDSNWVDGNCLWFAIILKERFSYSRIYYLPVIGHFVTKINGVFYDATGIIIPDEHPISLSYIKKTDSSWYERIIRDCFM